MISRIVSLKETNLIVSFVFILTKKVTATDKDRGVNAQFRYTLTDTSDTFQVDPNSGWISVKNSVKLDREAQSKFIVKVHAKEAQQSHKSQASTGHSECTVEINLLDANDNNPQFFPSDAYTFQVLETAVVRSLVGSVYAHDRDLGDNGRVRYHRQGSTGSGTLNEASAGLSMASNFLQPVPFDVHSENGSIYVTEHFKVLTRKAGTYTMFVVAEDQAAQSHERRSAVAVVRVNVTDINDSVPEFVGLPYTAHVGESLPEGAFVTQVQATDADDTDDILTYSIVAGNDEHLFTMDKLSGKVHTAAVLDFERKRSHDLLVQVSDSVNTAVAPLLVHVLDINDQLPIFVHSHYNLSIVEQQSIPVNASRSVELGRVQAQDMDSGKNAQIRYKILGAYANEAFEIDSDSGVIYAKREFDREQESEIAFHVLATDGGTPALSSSCSVRVTVQDINDNAPQFEQSVYEVEVREELAPPLDVIRLHATDADHADNAQIKYLLLAGNEEETFEIDENSGLLRTRRTLDFETRSEYVLHVAARNLRPFEGSNAAQIVNPAVQLIVRVKDVNDEPVHFDSSVYRFHVPENTEVGSRLGQVNASNSKRPSNEQEVVYWMEEIRTQPDHLQADESAEVETIMENLQETGPNESTRAPKVKKIKKTIDKRNRPPNDLLRKFRIDRQTGEILLVGPLDRDPPVNEHHFRLRVYARDLLSIYTHNSSATVDVHVLDVNDNAPTFDNDRYTLELPESLPAGTMFPAFFRVSDSDQGANGRISQFLLQSLDDSNENGQPTIRPQTLFRINNQTGSITLSGQLDFEIQHTHELLLLAMDGGQPPQVGKARVTVKVANVNEFAPKFSNLPYAFNVAERATVGTEIGRITATDDDRDKITYSIEPISVNDSNEPSDDVVYFSVDSQNGRLRVSQPLPARVQFTFVAKATDNGKPQNYSLAVPVQIRVVDSNDHAPKFAQEAYETHVPEKQETAPVEPLIVIHATDADLQDNIVSYQIVAGNDEQLFVLNIKTGELRLRPEAAIRLDYDRQPLYVLLVKASDSSPTPLHSLTVVKVHVLDTNDHPPTFAKPAYTASLLENLPAGHCFVHVQASSGDSVDQLKFSLRSAADAAGASMAHLRNHNLRGSNATKRTNSLHRGHHSKSAGSEIDDDGAFTIDEKTGQICTARPLDREQRALYELLVTADDGRFVSWVPLSFTVTDENDNAPQFEHERYHVTVALDTPPGSELIQLRATDADLANNGDLTYWIKNTHGLFEIDAKSGLVRLAAPLPRSSGNSTNGRSKGVYEMEVFAQDHGATPNIGRTLLVLRASSSQSRPPRFERFAYTVSVDENVSGVRLLQLKALEAHESGKQGKRNSIVYRLIRQPPGEHFTLDRSSGELRLQKPLNYERNRHLELTVEARVMAETGQGNSSIVRSGITRGFVRTAESIDAAEGQFALAVVQVNVRDVNDHAPELLAMPSTLRIPASTVPQSELIYRVSALDLDAPDSPNSRVRFELQQASAFFTIDPLTGAITANRTLTPLSETLVVIASDGGRPPLASVRELTLIVYKDSVEQPTPAFTSPFYEQDVDGSLSPGGPLMRVRAQTPNGAPTRYSLSSEATGQFTIDENTGLITAAAHLRPPSQDDPDPMPRPGALHSRVRRSSVFSFVVRAHNQLDNKHSAEAGIIVRLLHSDARCARFPFTQYYASVSEDSPVGHLVLPDLMIEQGAYQQTLHFQITEDNSNDNFYVHVLSSSSSGTGPLSAVLLDGVSTSNPLILTPGKPNSDHPDNDVSADQPSPVYGPTSGDSSERQPETGAVSVRVKRPLDRDTMSRFSQGVYTLTIQATGAKCTSRAVLKIEVQDVNDNAPLFESEHIQLKVMENTPAGSVVARLNATDADESDIGRLRYELLSQTPDHAMFQVEPSTGVVSLTGSPDRERSSGYELQVAALDSANHTGHTTLNIIVLDENDNAPTFLNQTFTLNVTEGAASVGARIRLPVYDLDDGPNRQMEVYIVDGNGNGEFRLDVDESGPMLTVVSALDRELYANRDDPHAPVAVHRLHVAAKDKGIPPRIGGAQVLVYINDINDTPPRFEQERYVALLAEDAMVGSRVAQVRALDADCTCNTRLVYAFSRATSESGETTVSAPFAIDAATGLVNVSRPLDISESQTYTLTVEAFDGLWKSSTTLQVFVSEAEQRNPRFGQTQYSFAVPENQADALVGKVQLQPRTARANALAQYVIVSGEMRTLFSIEASGEIRTRRPLDREQRARYTFTVMLEEKRPSSKATVAEVAVDVMDENDERPQFTQSYRATVKENSPPGTQLSLEPEPRVKAVDRDAGDNAIVRYHLTGSGSELFTVLDSGTILFTPADERHTLDREHIPRYSLTVHASDRGNLTSSTQLQVTVLDENDNAPVFQHGPLYIVIPETARPGSKIGAVHATDADDVGPNSHVQYYVTSGANGDLKVDRVSGELFVVGNLAPTTTYLLNVSAVDGAGLASRTFVNVTVVDVNDHRPQFDRPFYQFEVLEGNYTSERRALGVLRARDEDHGRNGLVEYQFSGALPVDFPFALDVHTGQLFASGYLDRESRELYKLHVIALDAGEPPLNSTTEVLVKVRDVNDERPRFYTDPYLAHVPENLDAGFKVTQIAAFDSDLGENGQVFYRLGEGHDGKFYIDGKDGIVWTLGPLDYEQKMFYNITVIAYDKGTPSLSSTAKLWVTVSDTNDAVPDFPKAIYTIEVAESAQPGQTVYTMDAGVGAKRYVLVHGENGPEDSFTLDASSGQVKLNKQLDSVQRNHYRLMVRAEDESDPPKSDTAELNIFVGTGQGVRLFASRSYHVSIAENQLAPSLLIDLNCTHELIQRQVRYSLLGTSYDGLFKIEPDSGRLMVQRSLDREVQSVYRLKVKAETASTLRQRRHLDDTFTEAHQSVNEHLAFDETMVIVNIEDENDNAPVFANGNRPIVAAVPLEANFGYDVTKITVRIVFVFFFCARLLC
jgi:hypothetical protein